MEELIEEYRNFLEREYGKNNRYEEFIDEIKKNNNKYTLMAYANNLDSTLDFYVTVNLIKYEIKFLVNNIVVKTNKYTRETLIKVFKKSTYEELVDDFNFPGYSKNSREVEIDNED